MVLCSIIYLENTCANTSIPSQAEVANREGNTPLHYACQYCPPGKTFTINKLLQQNCNVLVSNVAGDTPFDLAIRFNKIGECIG